MTRSWLGTAACPLPAARVSPEALSASADAAQQRKGARYLQLCYDIVNLRDFYRDRGINDDFTRQPQTPYSRKMFQAMHREEIFDKGRIFWTWHPDNFGSSFKSRIVFGAVPDQDTVEARMGGSRVAYDPPGQPPPVRPYCRNRRTAAGEPCVELKD